MKNLLENAVKKNIGWFRNSGIMRPGDGFWGVGERIAVTGSNEAKEKIDDMFPYQTRLNDDTVVLEQRRPDCCVETALMFELAAEYFSNEEFRQVAQNIITFLVNRSGLRITDNESDLKNLWEWAMPKMPTAWTDDNSWVITCFLLLSKRGYEGLENLALPAADAMYYHLRLFFEFIEKNGRDTKYKDIMRGTQLNPHWVGLSTMALATADAVRGTRDYYDVINKYYNAVIAGPPAWDEQSICKNENGIDWSISEYTYLTLITPIVSRVYDDEKIAKIGVKAADILLSNSKPDGHFTSNHYEAPEGDQFADLIYTQNWATLGFYHMAKMMPEKSEYREAFEKSAKFLVNIQDSSEKPIFNGCWRGMYDCDLKIWGGGNKYEGGQGSIYSGWTNAPISIALLLELTDSTLFI